MRVSAHLRKTAPIYEKKSLMFATLLSPNFRVAKLKSPGRIYFNIFVQEIADFKIYNYNYQNIQREYQQSTPSSAYLRTLKSLSCYSIISLF